MQERGLSILCGSRVKDASTPSYAPCGGGKTRHKIIPDILIDEETDDSLLRWYPLYIAYSSPARANNIHTFLVECGFEVFLPMERRRVETDFVIEYQAVPAVCNLIFLHAEKKQIKYLKRFHCLCSQLQFLSRRRLSDGRLEIIYVPDGQMNNFILANTLPDPYNQRISLEYSDFLAQRGKHVRILRGPFCGVEGEVKRIHRNKIVVALLREAKIAVGLTHIDPNDLELIDEK